MGHRCLSIRFSRLTLLSLLTVIPSLRSNYFSILNFSVRPSRRHLIQTTINSPKRTRHQSIGALLSRLFGKMDHVSHQKYSKVRSFSNSGIITDRFFLTSSTLPFSILMCALIPIRIHSTVCDVTCVWMRRVQTGPLLAIDRKRIM
jgi:hypothetical protein